MREDVLQKRPHLINNLSSVDDWSAQVSDHQEHENTGQQHPTDHDEFVLGRSPFYQSHHCVGQPQHVGHVQHLLMGPLCRAVRLGCNSQKLGCNYAHKYV